MNYIKNTKNNIKEYSSYNDSLSIGIVSSGGVDFLKNSFIKLIEKHSVEDKTIILFPGTNRLASVISDLRFSFSPIIYDIKKNDKAIYYRNYRDYDVSFRIRFLSKIEKLICIFDEKDIARDYFLYDMLENVHFYKNIKSVHIYFHINGDFIEENCFDYYYTLFDNTEEERIYDFNT